MSTTKEFKIKIDSNVKDATKDVKGLKKEFEGVADSAETASASTSEMSGALDGATGGKVTAFNGMKKSIIAVAKGFFTLKGAIIASGIGLLVIALVAVTQAFKGSEEGQNKFSKIMYGIGVVMDNILDLLADLGEKIIYAFENPVESLKAFGKAIIDNIVNRFMGMLELIPAIGSAISELFSGNFSKAGRIATNAMGKVVYGIENVVEKTEAAIIASQKYIEQQKKELKIANQISADRAFADVLERKLLVSRAKLQTEIAKLKLKSREEETVSAQGRKQALLDAQALEDGLLKKELEVAQLRFDSIKKENTLARSTKEAKLAEAQAEADLFNIIAKRTDAQRATQRELNRVNKEIAAAAKARRKIEEQAIIYGVEFTKKMGNEEIKALTKIASDKYKLLIEEGKKRLALQNSQDKLTIELMDEGFDKEVAKLVAKSEAQLLIAKGNKALELEVEAKFQRDLETLQNKDFISKEKKAQIDLDLFLMESGIEKEKLILEKSYEAKFKLAEGDAERTLALEQKLANQKKAIDEKSNASKVKMAGDAFGALGSLVSAFSAQNEADAKKQFKINKAFNLAQAVTNTALAVTGALTAGGNPVKLATGAQFVEAGIAGALGVANIVKIAGTQFSSADAGGIDGGSGQVPSVQAPNFNIVGDSGINQIASIQSQPMQAFVVSGEVTSAQALDRNREQNATL